MKKKQLINLDQKAADLKRFLREIEEKQKVSAGILMRELPAAKSAVYGHLVTLTDMSVAENHSATLLQVAHDCGETGVRLPILRRIMTDQVALDDARKELGSQSFNIVRDGETVPQSGRGYTEEKTNGNAVVIYITEAGKAAFTQSK